jgi:hypothetical protein
MEISGFIPVIIPFQAKGASNLGKARKAGREKGQ